MSVPPVMMAQVASRVYDTWIAKKPEPIDDVEAFEKKKEFVTKDSKGNANLVEKKPKYKEGSLFPEIFGY